MRITISFESETFPDYARGETKESGVRNTQLYKQAGNSIVVNVLEGIFKELLMQDLLTK